jgi:hypothetical protein
MALTSCTVPPDGAIGLTRDGAGHVRFVLQSCVGYHDAVELNGIKKSNLSVQYSHNGRLRGTSSFVADAPEASDGWTRKGSWDGTLASGARVYAYGATSNDHWSASGLEFSGDDLSHLQPSLILAESIDAKGHDLGRALLPPAQFAVAACRASGT